MTTPERIGLPEPAMNALRQYPNYWFNVDANGIVTAHTTPPLQGEGMGEDVPFEHLEPAMVWLEGLSNGGDPYAYATTILDYIHQLKSTHPPASASAVNNLIDLKTNVEPNGTVNVEYTSPVSLRIGASHAANPVTPSAESVAREKNGIIVSRGEVECALAVEFAFTGLGKRDELVVKASQVVQLYGDARVAAALEAFVADLDREAGFTAFAPTVRAVHKARKLALANKEAV